MTKILAALAACLAPVLVFSAAQANPPNAIELKYDPARQELGVQVEHIVSDRESHFIEKVVIYKNGSEVASKSFDFQTSKRDQTMPPFKVQASSRDNFKAIATCSKWGSKSATIVVE